MPVPRKDRFWAQPTPPPRRNLVDKLMESSWVLSFAVLGLGSGHQHLQIAPVMHCYHTAAAAAAAATAASSATTASIFSTTMMKNALSYTPIPHHFQVRFVKHSSLSGTPYTPYSNPTSPIIAFSSFFSIIPVQPQQNPNPQCYPIF